MSRLPEGRVPGVHPLPEGAFPGVDDGAVLCPDAARFADAAGWFAAAGLLLLSAALVALAGLIWLEARS